MHVTLYKMTTYDNLWMLRNVSICMMTSPITILTSAGMCPLTPDNDSLTVYSAAQNQTGVTSPKGILLFQSSVTTSSKLFPQPG